MIAGLLPTKGRFFRYILMPQIIPRFTELFAHGFAHIPYFMALLYQAVGLLPLGHPYVNSKNIGRFGIRHVVSQAASHLVMSWKNIDQIIVFIVVLAGLALIVAQIILLPVVLAMSFTPASAAQSLSFFDMIETPNPNQDIAHIMMDMIFGIPNMFNSCVSTGAACVDSQGRPVLTGLGGFPFPIHYGLHYLLSFYSTGILIIAVILVTYFVMVVVVETAQDGTPFGKRFNHAWAPIRLVLALGLLFPGGYGLNSAQFIVLYAAKFGSGLATNGWTLFLNTLGSTNLAQNLDLIATPNAPEAGELLQFFHVAATCKEAYELAGVTGIKPYLVCGQLINPPYLAAVGTSYQQMVNFANNGDRVFVRIGVMDSDKNVLYKGFVRPLCGELSFELTDPRDPSDASNPPDVGPLKIQEGYWQMLGNMWTRQFEAPNYPLQTATRTMPSVYDPASEKLIAARKKQLLEDYSIQMRQILADSVKAEIQAGQIGIPQEFIDKGWGFAGTLYNYVAEKGGQVTTAAFAVYTPSHFPELMEKVCSKRHEIDRNTKGGAECFNPISGGGVVSGITNKERELIMPMYTAMKDWSSGETKGTARSHYSSNALLEFVNAIFGTQGLFNMRENTNVHPLAQLTSVGRSLVESAVRNTGIALVSGAGGAFASLLGLSGTGAAIGSMASFMITISIVAMSIGFLLFYIIPALPFIYFFFGLGGWVKGIFEAMVGVPLWALAHIRIDGEGLAGDAAKSGYFLIFEIFLRPILLIFGFIAGMTIFAAMVMALNESFDLIVANLTGFSETDKLSNPGFTDIELYRGPVDSFFFTIVYTVTVYMMAMSSFKMIDLIPNSILRWMGISVKTFNDEAEDPAENMMKSASIGSQQAFGSIGGGLQGVVKSAGGAGGS